jgi:hypothetical protein
MFDLTAEFILRFIEMGLEEVADSHPLASRVTGTATGAPAALVGIDFLVGLEDDESVLSGEFELESLARRAPEEALDIQIVFRIG